MIKQLICIACPRGCRLSVHIEDSAENPPAAQNIEVSGNNCPKGIIYGRQEIIRPMRTLTTTVAYSTGGTKNSGERRYMRLPIKTVSEIPLKDMDVTIKKIRSIIVSEPVRCGDIIAVLKGEDGSDIPLAACTSTEDFA